MSKYLRKALAKRNARRNAMKETYDHINKVRTKLVDASLAYKMPGSMKLR